MDWGKIPEGPGPAGLECRHAAWPQRTHRWSAKAGYPLPSSGACTNPFLLGTVRYVAIPGRGHDSPGTSQGRLALPDHSHTMAMMGHVRGCAGWMTNWDTRGAGARDAGVARWGVQLVHRAEQRGGASPATKQAQVGGLSGVPGGRPREEG